jgi:hypothetical protein
MTKKILFIPIVLACFSYAIAQNNYIISGIVKDKKETLPGAAVYVSGYKIATTTDNEGKFILPSLPAGNYDILVQMIGYFPVSKNITIVDRAVNLEILLIENVTALKEVVIKPDPNRTFYLNLFKDFFIGKTPNAEQCRILNSEVLSFDDDSKNQILTARASDFLILENQALGYRIKYLLESFEYDYRRKIIYYAGHPSFEELKGNSSKQKKWQKSRIIAYNGSMQHFYKSLYQNKTAEEGFILNRQYSVPNTKRKPDSLINAHINRLINGNQGVVNLVRYNGGSDSLSYWVKQRSEPKTLNLLNRAPILTDTLVKNFDNDIKMMSFKDELYVIYTKEKESTAFSASKLKQSRPLDLGDAQISVITLLKSPIRFNVAGAVLDTRSVLYSGYWAYEKVGDLLPLDYVKTSP